MTEKSWRDKIAQSAQEKKDKVELQLKRKEERENKKLERERKKNTMKPTKKILSYTTADSEEMATELKESNEQPTPPVAVRRSKRERKSKYNSESSSSESETWEESDSSDDDDCDPINKCALCKKKDDPRVKGQKVVEWIACDVCDLWYHKLCVEVDEFDDDEQFTCKKCL